MSIVDEMDLRTRHEAVKAPRGRLARYGVFQLKEFAIERGIAMLLIGLMVAYPQVLKLNGQRFQRLGNFALQDKVPSIVASMMFMVFVVGGLLTVPIMVSRDRTQGFHRFLFAKPVSITSYYASQFLVQLAGFVGISALVMLGFNLFAYSFPIGGVLAGALVFFVGLGGLGFLFSTLVRADWIWLLGTVAASGIIGGWIRAQESVVLSPLLLLMPPIRELEVVMQLIAGEPYSSIDLAWVVAYGLTAFVAGLLVLRKRSITA